MKCNRCGSENADGSTFCATCGAQLSPNVTIAAPIGQNGPIVSGDLGSNGPVVSLSAPIKNKKVATIMIIIIALLICGGVTTALLLGGGKTTAYQCQQSSDTVTLSTTGTFRHDKIKKLEYTIIAEDDALGSSNSGSNNSFSYSGSSRSNSNSIHVESSGGITVYAPDDDDWDYYGYDGVSSGSSSSSNLDPKIGMAALSMSLLLAQIEEYSNDPGIDYYENERTGISTYSATIEFDKLSDKTKNAIFDDEDLNITPEEFQKAYSDQGFVCSKK